MHDPFQAYGSHYGMQTPIGMQPPSLQYPGINPAVNPLLGLTQLGQTGGIPQTSPYGQNVGQGFIHPQQLQLATLLAQALFQNPVLASLLSNPLLAASVHSQALGSQVAPQGGWQQPFYPQPGQYPQMYQMGSPFGQIGSPLGQAAYPLAPQSWIGQGGPFGGGQGYGPMHSLQSPMGQRPFQGQQGYSPWGY
ncbi:MAG TPA: hypothetical protein VL285_25340 [Bryobacteraceae bacterium]|jgi:hypothetical protein|nr:hypothetical protein [Bryobacteraceae bacterium]